MEVCKSCEDLVEKLGFSQDSLKASEEERSRLLKLNAQLQGKLDAASQTIEKLKREKKSFVADTAGSSKGM